MVHKLPDLPYDYKALEPHIDARTMRIHHDKHHAGYVAGLNEVLKGKSDLLKLDVRDLIADLHQVPENIRTKVRNTGGGHYNHSLFWNIMRPPAQSGSGPVGEPKGGVAAAIKDAFGSFKKFKEVFSGGALGHFGSGWAWLITGGNKLEVVTTPNQDSPISMDYTPILGIDVWEHAYYLKYQNKRADYISAWWNVVNWDQVEENFKKAI